MNGRFEFSLLSKYRAGLMGYAILGVMVIHLFMYPHIDVSGVRLFGGMVYTQGFFFLSGFGLYYSFSKNGNVVEFYKKRVLRLYIPYLIMAMPFLSFFYLGIGDVGSTVEAFFTVKFWTSGNYYGMWYVAVSIALYILYPWLHKLAFNKYVSPLLGGIIVLLLFVVGREILRFGFPSYNAMTGGWLGKTVMFPIGMIVGYLAKSNCSVSRFSVIVSSVILAIISTVIRNGDQNFYLITKGLAAIPMFCLLFDFVDKNRVGGCIVASLEWMGKYSLELYIYHLMIYNLILKVCDCSVLIAILTSIVVSLCICSPVHKVIDRIVQKF